MSAVRAGRWGGVAVAAAAAALLVPAACAACSSCTAGRGDANIAYLATAAAMGSLPIGFGVGLTLWLRKRSRDMEAGAAGTSDASDASDDAASD